MTTHSPAFVNILGAEGIVVVQKIEGSTDVTQLSRAKLAQYCVNTGALQAQARNILPFYAAAATSDIMSGLFARKVVLVEGQTEALALPVYCQQVGLNFTQEGIAVIPVHGVGNLAKWWRFFTAYGIPTYVTFDNDAAKGDDRQGFKRKDVLGALGIDSRSMEYLMSANDWIIRAECSVFGNDFETALRALFGGAYRDLEQEASNYGLDKRSKPLVARYVAENIEMPLESPAYEKFREFSERVRVL